MSMDIIFSLFFAGVLYVDIREFLSKQEKGGASFRSRADDVAKKYLSVQLTVWCGWADDGHDYFDLLKE